MSYVVPQVLVFQEFTQRIAPLVDPLRAFIVGPHYKAFRYSTATEKSQVSLGDYNPDSVDQSYSWPGKPVGSIIDTDFVRVFIDDAYLQYYDVGTGVEAPSRNRVRHPTTNFVEYVNPDSGTEYARATALLRDVKVGDIVNVRGDSGADDITASVIGFAHDTVASAVAAASADAANKVTTGLSTSNSKTRNTGADTVNISSVSGAAYDGRPTGDVTETYTITVTQGGAPSVARLSVVSASGRDDASGVTPAAYGSPTSIGSRGLTVTFAAGSGSENFVATEGDVWEVSVTQAYTLLSTTSGGTFDGPSDTTYIVEVTTGGAAGTAKISVATTTGIDSSGPHTVSNTSAIEIGSHGVTIAFSGGVGGGLAKGEKFYIEATSEADGPIRTLILSKNLTDDMFTEGYQGDMGLTLYMKKNIEVERCDAALGGITNFTPSNTELIINVNGTIRAYDPEWVDDDGELVSLPVRQGTLYAQYRALLTTYASSVQTIDDVGDVVSTLGEADTDNPLSLAVLKALSNSNGTAVKFMAVPTDDFTGYSAVIDEIVGREDVYGLVPLSYDREIQDLFAAHVDAMSSPTAGRWRVGWFGCQDVTKEQIGDDALATIVDDPDTSSTQYTIVLAEGATFLSDGVKAGDLLRTNFSTDECGEESWDEFVIDAVINEETLRLVDGPDAGVSVAQKAQIWRELSLNEQAENHAVFAGSFSNRRIRCVWPDQIGSAGVSMASFYAAAALAGLRSGVVPHQGLTNLEVAGFDDVRLEKFNATQLNTMAEAGVWIITQDPSAGDIYTRHQVTTGDTDDVAAREDSVVTDVDAISYYFLHQLAPFIGRANVTPQTLALIKTHVRSGIEFLKTNGFSETLGAMLIDGEVAMLRAHPTLADRVEIRLNLTIPFPLNNIELTLVI